MARWKYWLVGVALVSWFAKLSLEYISELADWFWYLSLGCWLALFFLVWPALFRGRWRELAIFLSTLVITFVPALNIGIEPIERFQEKAFRIYALYRIRTTPLEKFLSDCKLVDYVEDDGTKQRVGQCDDFRMNARWTQFSVIYDPTGQFALPGYQRTVAWRLAVQGSERGSGFNPGSFLKRTDRRTHLVGDFYFVKIYVEDWEG